MLSVAFCPNQSNDSSARLGAGLRSSNLNVRRTALAEAFKGRCGGGRELFWRTVVYAQVTRAAVLTGCVG
jgi:hypothetical protein